MTRTKATLVSLVIGGAAVVGAIPAMRAVSSDGVRHEAAAPAAAHATSTVTAVPFRSDANRLSPVAKPVIRAKRVHRTARPRIEPARYLAAVSRTWIPTVHRTAPAVAAPPQATSVSVTPPIQRAFDGAAHRRTSVSIPVRPAARAPAPAATTTTTTTTQAPSGSDGSADVPPTSTQPDSSATTPEQPRRQGDPPPPEEGDDHPAEHSDAPAPDGGDGEHDQQESPPPPHDG